MNARPRWLLWATLAGTTAAFLACGRPVAAQDLNPVRTELADIEATVEQMVKLPLRRASLRSATHVEERLTDGELFYRLQDFLRAAVIFTDIVDNYPQHAAYADALFLLADSLFRAGDYLGARTRFREVLARSTERAFQPYVQRALGRLIEVAIHIRDFEGVDAYFERLSRLPPTEVEAATAYFRAKYLYNRAVPLSIGRGEGPISGQLDAQALAEARQAFEAVSVRSPYYSQARYFIGVILTLQGQLAAAAQSFERVLAAEVTTAEQRAVAELTHLALGRVYYEQDKVSDAVAAYEAIDQTSLHFDTALYEVAWVYLRMGNSVRAEQSLELLGIAVPDSRYIADANLLRGNLLLREGRFDDAEQVFGVVHVQFGPIRKELDEMVADREDPAAYFCQLVRENMQAFDANAFIPPKARRWAEPGPEMERALTGLADLAQAQQLVQETESIVHRLGRALQAPNRVNMFADLRLHRERTVTLRNRLARARRTILAAEQEALAHANSAALTQVRARRRRLEQRLNAIPVTSDAVQERSARSDSAFVRLSRELKRLEVELMGLDARVVAIDRFVNDAFEKPEQAQGVDAYLGELAGHKAAIEDYRERARKLLLDVEAGRLQIGVGDHSFQRDDQLRQAYREVVEEERRVVSQLGGVRAGTELEALFARVLEAEAALDAHDHQVDTVAQERAARMQGVLDEERVKLDGYRARLADLSGTTEVVVGEIAYRNYSRAQRRFYDLVLRADVGTIDVAWARREEHRMRVENLTRDRNAALSALESELSEIMDQEGKR